MRRRRVLFLVTATVAMAAIAHGCSGSQDRVARGSLSVRFSASGLPSQVEGGSRPSDDPMGHVLAAKLTISELEARRSDGTWVPVDGGFPTSLDFPASPEGPGSLVIPARLVREGQHNALQVRISLVELNMVDGSQVAIAPPRTGWSVLLPVDFGVTADEETIVALTVRVDRSFHLVDGRLEFDPDVDVAGVEHR